MNILNKTYRYLILTACLLSHFAVAGQVAEQEKFHYVPPAPDPLSNKAESHTFAPDIKKDDGQLKWQVDPDYETYRIDREDIFGEPRKTGGGIKFYH